MSFVEQAQAQGIDVLPRPTAGALALLGLVPRRVPQPWRRSKRQSSPGASSCR
jgi:hypothetical protein